MNERLAAIPAATPELGDLLLSISSGATPRRSDASLYADAGIKLLRILNVDDGEIVDEDMKFITAAVHTGQLQRSQLSADDVLMTITGRVGSAAVVRESHLPANINQHIVRMRIDTTRCHPEFLAEWLNCPSGLELSNRGVSGGTRPALDYGAVRRVRIPLPDLETQDGLIQEMNAAREQRKTMLEQADSLIASVNDFVLDTLSIAPPDHNPIRVYAVRQSQLSGQNRLDSDYYHPERISAISTTESISLPLSRLAEVVVFKRDGLDAPLQNHLTLSHVQSHTGELSDSTLTTSGNALRFQPDDVLFARLGAYLNKVHRAETGGSCSTDFIVLRVKDTNALLPEYLAAILRTRLVLAQTTHMITGNTHPRVTNYDMENLAIPIPPLSVQQTIADEIVSRRAQARQLREQADAILRQAKRTFEERLLGHP